MDRKSGLKEEVKRCVDEDTDENAKQFPQHCIKEDVQMMR